MVALMMIKLKITIFDILKFSLLGIFEEKNFEKFSNKNEK